MSDAVFQPNSVKPVFVRPLDKGMILDQPSQVLPDGAFLKIKNFIAGTEGLRRRPGSTGVGLGQSFPYVLSDMIAVWRTDGLQKLIIVTRSNLYVLDLSTGRTEVAWAYSTGTVTISGTSVTGAATAWLSGDILPGDILRTADGEAVIDQVTSDTTIVLKSVGTLINRTAVSYNIQRTFSPGRATEPVFDMLDNHMMIADGKRPLLRYDPLGGTLGYWTTDPKKRPYLTAAVTYSTGTVSVAAASLQTLTGSGTTWVTGSSWVGKTVEVTVGGVAYLDTIAAVASTTSLTLANPGLIPVCTGATYRILTYSGTAVTPACCCGFMGRAWIGYTWDTVDGECRQRIRWSSIQDSSDFSIETNWLDLPFTATPLKRLVPLGEALVAYFGDAVYIGFPTNNPLIPLQFQKVETGGIGLTGSKAVMSWLGVHFFVGQDDVYMLSTNGIQRIGTPIQKESIKLCQKSEFIRVQADPYRTRILFGFPGAEEYTDRVWSYEYKSKAWSYDDIQTYMIANPVVTNALSWDGLAGGTWDALGGTYSTWDNMKSGGATRSIYYEGASKIWQVDDAQGMDRGSIVISPQFETKDYDFELPDVLKIVTGFNVKISCVESGSIPAGDHPLQIQLEVSTNRGTSWKSIGTLQIPELRDEGWLTFRAKGSTFRFRGSIVGTPPQTSYTITEHGMRVRIAGSELSYGTHRA